MGYQWQVTLIGLTALGFVADEAVDREVAAQARQWLMEPIGDSKERGAGKAERVAWASRGFDHLRAWTPLLIAWAARGEPSTRGRAVAALAEFAVQRLVREEPVGDGEPFQEVLIANLKDPDASIRALSADALAFCRGPGAVPHLIAAMGDPSEVVRVHATDAVGHYGDRRAVEPLLAALKDGSPIVRNEAADALWVFGEDKRMVEALIEALFDTVSGVAAGNIVIALDRLGVRSEPILKFEGRPEDGEPKGVIVGYRVKARGDATWRERHWSR
jgi:hypothetical protein